MKTLKITEAIKALQRILQREGNLDVACVLEHDDPGKSVIVSYGYLFGVMVTDDDRKICVFSEDKPWIPGDGGEPAPVPEKKAA